MKIRRLYFVCGLVALIVLGGCTGTNSGNPDNSGAIKGEFIRLQADYNALQGELGPAKAGLNECNKRSEKCADSNAMLGAQLVACNSELNTSAASLGACNTEKGSLQIRLGSCADSNALSACVFDKTSLAEQKTLLTEQKTLLTEQLSNCNNDKANLAVDKANLTTDKTSLTNSLGACNSGLSAALLAVPEMTVKHYVPGNFFSAGADGYRHVSFTYTLDFNKIERAMVGIDYTGGNDYFFAPGVQLGLIRWYKMTRADESTFTADIDGTVKLVKVGDDRRLIVKQAEFSQATSKEGLALKRVILVFANK